MKDRIAYDDAIDLLDADHKVVKKMFIEYASLCDEGAPTTAKHGLALRICRALVIHAQIEEEIFYPAVRKAIGNDDLMDRAMQEHAEAKLLIATIQAMKAKDRGLDAAVQQLRLLIDEHVLEELEQIFLRARLAALDLRGLAPALLHRRRQVQQKVSSAPATEVA